MYLLGQITEARMGAAAEQGAFGEQLAGTGGPLPLRDSVTAAKRSAPPTLAEGYGRVSCPLNQPPPGGRQRREIDT